MARTITVKGVGKVSARPDYVSISMTLEAQDMKYDNAMALAAEQIDQLNDALKTVGFEKDAVKTTNFHVHTNYVSERDTLGNYKNVFNGYAVTHDLKLNFDLDMARLSAALGAISTCQAHPQVNITFTVKDVTAVKNELLYAATANARKKAEILCQASGVTLGVLSTIDYNWSELNVHSNTRFNVASDCLAAPMMAKGVTLQPEDISLSDSATFVWEIV